jgi:hypothetical protein
MLRSMEVSLRELLELGHVKAYGAMGTGAKCATQPSFCRRAFDTQ